MRLPSRSNKRRLAGHLDPGGFWLPEDLAALDVLLRDPELLAPIAAGWREEAVSQGRPSIVMEAYSA